MALIKRIKCLLWLFVVLFFLSLLPLLLLLLLLLSLSCCFECNAQKGVMCVRVWFCLLLIFVPIHTILRPHDDSVNIFPILSCNWFDTKSRFFHHSMCDRAHNIFFSRCGFLPMHIFFPRIGLLTPFLALSISIVFAHLPAISFCSGILYISRARERVG